MAPSSGPTTVQILPNIWISPFAFVKLSFSKISGYIKMTVANLATAID